MKDFNSDKQLKVWPYAEEDALAIAEKELGAIPEWYLENKEAVARSRTEQAEFTQKMLSEIQAYMDLFNSLPQ
ncbi:hypothetical protein LJC26_07995 [Desulfovibrio sp. OttesenSCG-928-O18]|nr:hypothetical protein [Desulfovibrio sp. OttesenSCG-928-O18]